VGGEDRARAAPLQRGVEVHALVHVLADPFQAEESRMSLVRVEDLGGWRTTEVAVGPDGPHAADPEQHLLREPVIGAAAVEPVGHLPLVAAVLLDVGVEEQQRYPADARQPDLGEHRTAAERHLDPDWAVVAV
jgi:hypothetical protein